VSTGLLLLGLTSTVVGDTAVISMSHSTSFPKRIRRVRKSLNLTTRQLDEKAGVSFGYTWRVERGERPTMRTDTLEKYARALGVSLAWLLTGDGEAREAS